ncbi:MAG TPA: hypothetical protein VLJ59_06040 [Mycobacteriales bacterium]|nr:hypothetical protein [Mycobacteriales bacterium]
MSITADVRKAGETVLEQGKAVLDDARKPLYAVVGAGDLAVTTAVSQVKELPGETQTAVDTRVKKAQARLDDIRTEAKARYEGLVHKATELQGKARELPSKADALKPKELRSTVETYVGKAKELYDDLAARGEKIVTKVADQPGIKTVIDRAEVLFDRVEERVEHVIEAATEDPEAPPRKAPAKKTPPRKTTTG